MSVLLLIKIFLYLNWPYTVLTFPTLDTHTTLWTKNGKNIPINDVNFSWNPFHGYFSWNQLSQKKTLFQIFFRKLDFSLWGKQLGLAKLHIFNLFSICTQTFNTTITMCVWSILQKQKSSLIIACNNKKRRGSISFQNTNENSISRQDQI